MSKNCMIFDIDGCLADPEHRMYMVDGTVGGNPPNWDKFFAACIYDDPHEGLCSLARMVSDSETHLILLTGRPERIRAQTSEWLKSQGIFYDKLILRSNSDFRANWEYKEAELKKLKEEGFNVTMAVDDDPHIISMYRRNGIQALAAHFCGM